MQHDIFVHLDSNQNTMDSKLSKDVADYVRLCLDVGGL